MQEGQKTAEFSATAGVSIVYGILNRRAIQVQRLLEFRDRLRAWLGKQPQVVGDKVDVHIHQITDRGVELSLSLFLATGRVAEETSFREAINCEILQQAGALGMDIAPTYRKSLLEQAGERSGGDATARVARAA